VVNVSSWNEATAVNVSSRDEATAVNVNSWKEVMRQWLTVFGGVAIACDWQLLE
jgi:hypothetical protein